MSEKKAKGKMPAIRFKGFSAVWEVKALGNESEIKAGGTPSTNITEYWEPKEIPWMSSGEINKKRLFSTEKMISSHGLNNSSAQWIPKKSVLIALAGQGKTRGMVAINNIPLTTNQSIAAIIPSENINYEYLYQNLSNRYEELRMSSSGDGSRGGLNKQILSEVLIQTPEIKEQTKIGKLFQQLDTLINQHQQKHEKLRCVKKALLTKMFPKQGETQPAIRFKGFSAAWEEKALGDVAPDISDGDWIESDHIFNSGKYRIIQTGNLGLGDFIDKPSHAKYFHQKDFDEIKANEIYPDDLLISRLAEPAGRTIELPNTKFRMVTAVDVTVIRPSDKFNSTFLKTQLNSPSVLKVINESVSGTSHKRISRANLEKVNFDITSIEEQTKIGKLFQQLDTLINQHQTKINKLNQIKQAMLAKMFV